MKKVSLLLIFAVLLSAACSISVEQFLGTPPTSTAAPVITNTPTNIPTITPTVPTPTFTLTPTMVGLKTKTSTSEVTPTQLLLTQPGVTTLPSETPAVLITPVSTEGFISIAVSSEQFYKGKGCLPVSVKFTVQAADPANAAFVTLFVRFKSKKTDAKSEWTSIAMQSIGAGTFTHDLISSEMKAVDSFENAWVQYQIVSSDTNSKQLGKTDVLGERLTLLECVPTLTPTASVTPTTVLVP
jgi:hypothetical protein